MTIKNLFEKVESILNESVVDDAAKLLGMERNQLEPLIKTLPFAKYLELGNAVDIGDKEAAQNILSAIPAMDDGQIPGDVVEEGDVVSMDKYRKAPVPAPKGSGRTFALPAGTKVRLAAGTIPGVDQAVVGKIVDVANDGRAPIMYKVKIPFQREPILAVEDEIQVVTSVTEADNPYQKVTPPSQQLPSKTVQQQNQPAQQSNIGRKDVDDLLPGDEIEVIDIDGEPTATTVKNPRGPGDTLVVQDEHRREHVIKKTNVSGTPKLKESGQMFRSEDAAESYLLDEPLGESSMSVRVCTECGGKGQAKYKENGEMVLDTCRKCDGMGELDGMDDEFFGHKGRSDFDESIDRMKKLAGIPSVALVRENYGAGGMYNHKDQWLADAQSKGYQVEPSGDGKIIAHVDGVEKGYWDPYYGGAGMGYFHAAAEGKSDAMMAAGAENVPLSKEELDDMYYRDHIEGELDPYRHGNHREMDESFWRTPPKNHRTMKTGHIKSKAIGKTVKIFAGDHAGKTGVVKTATREPTFSAMVPYKTIYGIELPDGKKVYVRRDDVRALKQQPVSETASCGATGAGAVASAPAAVGAVISRNGTAKKKKKDYGIGKSIYKETKKPEPKAQKEKGKRGDGVGRSKKD